MCSFRSGVAKIVERLIRKSEPQLPLTVEQPEKGVLQFLYLWIHIGQGLCCEYGRGNPKPILPRRSCHSKTLKAVVLGPRITIAMNISCIHYIAGSVKSQYKWLCGAGCEEDFICRQMTKMSERTERDKDRHKKPYAVTPCYHEILYTVRRHVRRSLVWTLCLARTSSWGRGTKAHREKSVICERGVVYEIFLACWFKYMGKTCRCPNYRLTEHRRNVEDKAPNSY